MRMVTVTRETKETRIELTLNLDGTGTADVDTGVGFFDHMLCGFAKHGLFDLYIRVSGDLQVDDHHTIEDTGIVLGDAIKQVIGDKSGIARYGNFILPMDEALILCAVDLSGRSYYSSDLSFTFDKMGDMSTQMVREFFGAVASSAMMNLHFKQLSGLNDHHIAEGAFKAFAKALDMATKYDDRIKGALSTKGTI